MSIPGSSHLFSLPSTSKYGSNIRVSTDNTWRDAGTGDLYGEFNEKTQEYKIVMADRVNPSRILFSYTFGPRIIFLKQEACIIASTYRQNVSGESISDYNDETNKQLTRFVFEFDTLEGCLTLCDFYLYAASKQKDQQNITFLYQNPLDALHRHQYNKPTMLPLSPNQLNLRIVMNTINETVQSPYEKEVLTLYLDKSSFFDKMWDIFLEITDLSVPDSSQSSSNGSSSSQQLAEARFGPQQVNETSPYERIQILWTISDIIKQYICIGETRLLEKALKPDNFVKLLCMLEYDRLFGTKKANYEEFYTQKTSLRQVVGIDDFSLMEKIRKTFRLHLLQDISARWIDEETYRLLKLMVHLHNGDIIAKLQSSTEFCDELFGLFDDDGYTSRGGCTCAFNSAHDTSSPIKDNALRFIYELIMAAKSLPFQQSKLFFSNVVFNGLFNAILGYGLAVERSMEIKMLAIESIKKLLEHDNSLIRPYMREIFSHALTLHFHCPHINRGTNKDTHRVTRVLQIEIGMLMNKLIALYSPLAIQQFFQSFLTISREHGGSLISDTTRFSSHNVTSMDIRCENLWKFQQTITFIDTMIHCFGNNAHVTSMFTRKFEIWDRLGDSYRQQERSLNRHTKSQLLTYLMRLIRAVVSNIFRIPVSDAIAELLSVLNSGMFKEILKQVCDSRSDNDIQHSCFMNLMTLIVDTHHGDHAEFVKPLVSYLQTDALRETKALCVRYPILRGVLPRKTSNLLADNVSLDEDVLAEELVDELIEGYSDNSSDAGTSVEFVGPLKRSYQSMNDSISLDGEKDEDEQEDEDEEGEASIKENGKELRLASPWIPQHELDEAKKAKQEQDRLELVQQQLQDQQQDWQDPYQPDLNQPDLHQQDLQQDAQRKQEPNRQEPLQEGAYSQQDVHRPQQQPQKENYHQQQPKEQKQQLRFQEDQIDMEEQGKYTEAMFEPKRMKSQLEAEHMAETISAVPWWSKSNVNQQVQQHSQD